MSARHGKHARREPRGGFTLVELLLATGLLALLVMLVFQLFDRTLSLWRTGETRRSTMEQATVVADLLADDLRSLEPGAAGDLVVEWTRHDLDADGVLDAAWPRVRMVRIAGAAEVSRLRQQLSLERAEEQPDASLGPVLEAAGPELVEVQWAVVPASLVDRDARAEGRVLRGARLVATQPFRIFDEEFDKEVMLLSKSQLAALQIDADISGARADSGTLWPDGYVPPDSMVME